MAKLLLIAPPREGLIDGLPHGLVALSSYIRQKAPGHTLTVLDLGGFDPACAECRLVQSVRTAPDLLGIGFTTLTSTYRTALRLAASVKRERPDLPILFGGPHATYQDDVILRNHKEVDLVIRGEGEKPLLAFFSFAQGRDWEKIPSATYRQNSDILKTADAPALSGRELSEIPLDLGARRNTSSFGREHRISYVSSRGCPRSCRFCVAGRMPFRSKSIEAFRADMAYLVQEGFRKIAIEDNDFLSSRKNIETLCAIFMNQARLPQGLDWDCQARVDSRLDTATLDRLSAAGCTKIFFGLESFHGKSLAFLGKTRHGGSYGMYGVTSCIVN